MTDGENSTTLRMFCAIDLPPGVLSWLEETQNELKAALSHSRVFWSQPAKIHLTLVFLGNVEASLIQQISDAMKRVWRASPSMYLRIVDRGCFPNARHPHVVWIGVNDRDGRLDRLQAGLEVALRPFIEEPDDRAFRPHLTLARIRHFARRDRASLDTWLAQPAGLTREWPVTAVRLYSSHLSARGAKYSVLAEHRLSGE